MSATFNRAALLGLSLNELQALYQRQQQELIRSERGSQQRRDALANLEALSLAMAHRRTLGGPRP